MNKNRKKKIWILAGLCAGIGFLCFTFFWLLPTVFQKWVSETAIESFLSRYSGWTGMGYLALFQAAQVLSIFLPGAAVQIAGGLVYGTAKSFFICLASFVGTNMGVFALARTHHNLMSRPGSKRNRNMQKVLDWINSSDPFFMCMLAYMMPGIPNGFIPYAAVRTEVTLRKFFLSVLFGSLFQIFVMCSIGGRIMSGDFEVSFFLVIGSLALIFILYKTKDGILSFLKKYKRNLSQKSDKH
jgi:uncharacterized membrane protein YdjX (TVP38/TMEM64 family)